MMSIPYKGGWWPQGHGIGYADSFVIEVAEFIRSISAGTGFSLILKMGSGARKYSKQFEKSSVNRTWMKI